MPPGTQQRVQIVGTGIEPGLGPPARQHRDLSVVATPDNSDLAEPAAPRPVPRDMQDNLARLSVTKTKN